MQPQGKLAGQLTRPLLGVLQPQGKLAGQLTRPLLGVLQPQRKLDGQLTRPLLGVLQPPYRKPSPGSSLANEWFLCQNFAQLDHFRPWRCYLELQNAPQVLQVVILQLESFLSTSDSHSGQRPKVV